MSSEAAAGDHFFDPRFFISSAYMRRDEAVYDELHRAGPSVQTVMGEVVNGWLPLRRTLRSPEAEASTGVRNMLWRGMQHDFPPAAELTSSWLVFTHGDEHERLRTLALDIVDGSLRHDLCQTFERRLGDTLDCGPARVDLIQEVIGPSVGAVLTRQFGDGQRVEPQVERLGGLVVPLLDMTCRRRDLRQASDVCERVDDDPAGVAAHLARSGNPTVRALAAGTHEGHLSTFELVGLLAFLIGAASETTNLMMASLAWALADADVWRQATEDRSDRFVERVVAEAVRLASPIQAIGRMVGDGDTIRPVIFNLAAANRDPTVFSDPHALTLNPGDGRRPHVAFGHGAHYCVGAATARAMGGVFVRSLLARRRKPVVDAPPKRGFRYFIAAVESYPVGFEDG